MGCYSLLQGVFPAQELNLGLLHCRQILYHLNQGWGPFSVSFDKCIMICISMRMVVLLYTICLQYPLISAFSPFPNILGNHWYFIVSLVFYFSRISYTWNHTMVFHINFFFLAICFFKFHLCFHGLIAHFFLLLTIFFYMDIPPFFIHLPAEGHFYCSHKL